MEFEEEIPDLQCLRELMPFDASSGSALKVTDSVNDVARRFIELCPFIVIATKANGGLIDVSPKGDPAGFVKVLDDRTLAINVTGEMKEVSRVSISTEYLVGTAVQTNVRIVPEQ